MPIIHALLPSFLRRPRTTTRQHCFRRTAASKPIPNREKSRLRSSSSHRTAIDHIGTGPVSDCILRMRKTCDERKWEWLRVGRRIEHVSILFALGFTGLSFSLAVFSLPPDLKTVPILLVFFAGCAAFCTVMSASMYLALRLRRKREGTAGLGSYRVPLSRLRTYLLLTFITVASATWQAQRQVWSGTTRQVFFGNFVILGCAIVVDAMRRKWKK